MENIILWLSVKSNAYILCTLHNHNLFFFFSVTTARMFFHTIDKHISVYDLRCTHWRVRQETTCCWAKDIPACRRIKIFLLRMQKVQKIEYMSAVCSSGCRCCEPYLGIGILSPSAEKLRTNLSRRKHSMDFLHQGTTRRGLPKLKCLKCPVESQGLSRIEQ